MISRGFITTILLITFLVLGSFILFNGNFEINSVNAKQEKPKEWSKTGPYPVRDVYYPGTETLAPNEMRIIACGTGMPQPRLKQAAACFLVELGNGDKFIFDMGEGANERIAALGIPLDQLN